MKIYFATLIVMAIMAVILPIAASAQTYSTRRVYRDGRWQTVRVYTTSTNRGNHYGWRNRNRGITLQEQRRLARQRNLIVTLLNRGSRDGVITPREVRKVNKRTYKYLRKVNRARNN